MRETVGGREREIERVAASVTPAPSKSEAGT